MMPRSESEQGCTNGMTRKNDLLDGFRVIHLHPTLKCNLACHHCYSSSSPVLKRQLDAKEIISFLGYARTYGFNALSVSGGEPFLYSGLEEVLRESKKLGYKNLAASNGMLLQSEKNKRIVGLIDLLAISIDGDARLHDEIRNFKGAYTKMLEGLAVLNDLEVDFGFIHTLTPRSWELLPWLADFAINMGAKLLQLHPLELYGRAATQSRFKVLEQELLHKVFIFGNFLKSKYYPDMHIQLDFLHREHIEAYPQTATYFGSCFKVTPENFSSALKTIVIDERGSIQPISYGFSNQYAIGTLKDLSYGIDPFLRYIDTQWNALYHLLGETFNEIVDDTENDMIAWTELIVKKSHAIHHPPANYVQG